MKHLVCFLIFWLTVIAPVGTPQADEAGQITPQDVFKAVVELRSEIEQVRVVMGRPKPTPRSFRVRDVEPRHVYYQAQTLFRKANQLAQDVVGITRQAPRPAPEADIQPADVLGLVNDAQLQIQTVKNALGVDTAYPYANLDKRKDLPDVLHDIVEAGRQLNWMMDRLVGWDIVYDRVILALTYMAGVLPDERRYPDLPAHQTGKFPDDVYDELMTCMELSRAPAKQHGVTVLRLEIVKPAEGGATPVDVYDLATTILSDIADLTWRLDGKDVAPPDYPHPDRVFPSHVYQLVKVLEAQLTLLAGVDGN